MADVKRCKRCNDANHVVDVDDFIECPVCLSPILDPPVYMCSRSHIFCEDCHISLKRDNRDCPVCQGDLAGNKNIPVEKMLDSLPKTQCRNQGCAFEKVDSKKVEGHKDTCQHRLIKCLKCERDVPLINMSEHMWNEHSYYRVRDKLELGETKPYCWCVKVPGTISVPLPVEGSNGKQLFFLCRYAGEDEQHLWWISQGQSKKPIKKFKYTLSFLCGKAFDDGGKRKRLVTYSGFCVPVDATIEDIKKDMPCVSLPKGFFEQNLDKDQRIRFEWCISILD